jgi:hypothetical protein
MIVSHRHQFIFIKNRKTAGTSVELALCHFCGPDDIITLTTSGRRGQAPSDEPANPGPRHHMMPLRLYTARDWVKLLTQGKRKKRYFNHASAAHIRAHLGEDIWNRYYKFCIERDPFDKAVSLYHWHYWRLKRDAGEDINEFLLSVKEERLSNWHLYTLDNRLAVDFVGKYESLADDLAAVRDHLGLPGELHLPNAKGGLRDRRQHYSELLDHRARQRIERVCANELAAFNYHWQDSGTASPADAGEVTASGK